MKPVLVSRKALVVALLMALAIACNVADKKTTGIFSPGNLPLDEYTIDITRDTVLHTKRGAIIRIPAGSIEAKEKQITLQLREAFSIADIVAAGLATTSNGTPLSSGGMIYINAADQNGARVIKPIAISIPTDYVQKGMQLYRGEEKDGGINWIDPVALQQAIPADPINTGLAIFTSQCASCHDIGHERADIGTLAMIRRSLDITSTDSSQGSRAYTGGDLTFITERRDKKWLDSFINNSSAVIASGDKYANCIYGLTCRTAMPSFPNLDRKSLDALYEYIENESKQYDPKNFPDFKKVFDSCQRYNELYELLQEKRTKLVIDNGQRVEVRYWTSDSVRVVSRDTVIGTGKVSIPYTPAEYYKFEVDAFGWYNIDQVVDKVDGYGDSKLTVAILPMDNTPDVFLIVPSEKIFQRGGFLNGSNTVYGFYQDDGTIRLPQGATAYILAVTEGDGKMMMGLQQFTTGAVNDVSVQMSNVTKEEYESKMQQFKAGGLSTTVNRSKNADSILVIDKELEALEALHPKTFDCHCSCGDVSEKMVH